MSATTVTGTVHWVEMGAFVWALAAEDGTQYQLYGDTAELEQENLKAKVEGQIREDLVTTSMIGPVLEVQSYEILS
ncbi:MAG: hypothetical protein F6J97_11160 [Leptolyngbya sp. SIO4C1]|nr:hypothetical protein [Leptolyngbya sp. SIO4C1]